MEMKDFLNKKVKIIYDDMNRIVTKHCVFLNYDTNFVVIKNDQGNNEAISVSKIIRIEEERDAE